MIRRSAEPNLEGPRRATGAVIAENARSPSRPRHTTVVHERTRLPPTKVFPRTDSGFPLVAPEDHRCRDYELVA